MPPHLQGGTTREESLRHGSHRRAYASTKAGAPPKHAVRGYAIVSQPLLSIITDGAPSQREGYPPGFGRPISPSLTTARFPGRVATACVLDRARIQVRTNGSLRRTRAYDRPIYHVTIALPMPLRAVFAGTVVCTTVLVGYNKNRESRTAPLQRRALTRRWLTDCALGHHRALSAASRSPRKPTSA